MSVKKTIKKIGKSVLPQEVVLQKRHLDFLYERSRRTQNESKYSFYAHNLIRTKVTVKGNETDKTCDMLDSVKFCFKDDDFFFYSIDPYKSIFSEHEIISNLSIDYGILLTNGLDSLALNGSSVYIDNNNKLVSCLGKYLEKAISAVGHSKNANKDMILQSLTGMRNKPAQGFFDALQRILFVNQLLWQTGHGLNGLGRLDFILDKYYRSYIIQKDNTSAKAELMVEEFIKTLHKYYWFKSSVLMGDTGQIIVLGGVDVDGEHFESDLTGIFIDAIKNVQLPDPKVLLRVTNETSDEIYKKALDCMATGCGSPLFSNDEVIIPCMCEFGYTLNDSRNYTVSACWEPTVAGVSADSNNIFSLNFCEPFISLFEINGIEDTATYEEFLSTYYEQLRKFVLAKVDEAKRKIYQRDPYLSLMVSDCSQREKDVTEGGARYMNIGFTGLGMANVVDSLLNIRQYVYAEKKVLIRDVRDYISEKKELPSDVDLKNGAFKFGQDNYEVIDLVNGILNVVKEELESKRYNGEGKFKIGLSSPSYIISSKDFPRTFDGREKGDPFNVHISCMNGIALTELIDFSAKIDYHNGAFNGNVVDFVLTPDFIINNSDKMAMLLKLAVKQGFFQMQFNVLSYKMLVEAKENPNLYPNLIVRVWGFSAYFNDLPTEYKNMLIERAKIAEGAE